MQRAELGVHTLNLKSLRKCEIYFLKLSQMDGDGVVETTLSVQTEAFPRKRKVQIRDVFTDLHVIDSIQLVIQRLF